MQAVRRRECLQRQLDGYLLQAAAEALVPSTGRESEGSEGHQGHEGEGSSVCLHVHQCHGVCQGTDIDHRQGQEPALLWPEVLPHQHFAQSNAWSDGATCRKWWMEAFLPIIRSWTTLPVLCLIEGCASHDLMVDLKGQVETIVYPPNCTSKHQPMDMGIIAATKLHDRRRFLSVRVSTKAVVDTLRAQAKERKIATGMAVFEESRTAHVLDAAELLEAAWGDISPSPGDYF